MEKLEEDKHIGNSIMPLDAFPLDYAYSEDAIEIDKGIRDTIRGIHLSILAMGLGLANIKAKRFYKNLGCKSMTAYIIHLCEECRVDRSTIFNWLYIGEAYIKYRSELEQVGFTDSDGPAKLPFLDRALAVYEKKDVFQTVKNVSVREFVNYAKGGKENSSGGEDKTRWVISEKGNSFYVNGKLAIIISSKMNRRAAAYLKKVIRTACEALEQEGLILPVFIKSKKEAIRIEGEVERLKAQIMPG